MIEAILANGLNLAKVTCDVCGASHEETADYRRTGGRNVVNEGQVIRRLTGKGWTLVKKKLRCPSCEAARKAATHKPKPENDQMTTKTEPLPVAGALIAPPTPAVPALREPTGKQKREIISMLELAWDDARSRFKAGESDKTVAEAIGGGVMWGWVKQIREDMFGHDTRNEEAEKLAAELKDLRSDMDTRSMDMRLAIEKMRGDMEKAMNGYGKRIEAIQRKLDAVLK